MGKQTTINFNLHEVSTTNAKKALKKALKKATTKKTEPVTWANYAAKRGAHYTQPVFGGVEADRRAAEIIAANKNHAEMQTVYNELFKAKEIGKAPVPTASEPVTWAKYAAEHGTQYTQPVSGVVEADRVAAEKIANYAKLGTAHAQPTKAPLTWAKHNAAVKEHNDLQKMYEGLFGGSKLGPVDPKTIDNSKELARVKDLADRQKMYEGLFGGSKLGPVDPKTIDNSKELARIKDLANADKQQMYNKLFGAEQGVTENVVSKLGTAHAQAAKAPVTFANYTGPGAKELRAVAEEGKSHAERLHDLEAAFGKPVEQSGGLWGKIKQFSGTKGGKAALIIGGVVAAAALGYGIYKLVEHCKNKKAEDTTPVPVAPVPEPVEPATLPVATVAQGEEDNFHAIQTKSLTWAEIVTAYYPGLVDKCDGKLYGEDGAIRKLKEALNACGTGDLVKETDIPRILNLPLAIDEIAINKDANPHKIKITIKGGHTDIKEAGCKETKPVYTVTDVETGKTATANNLEEALKTLKTETGVEEYQLDYAS